MSISTGPRGYFKAQADARFVPVGSLPTLRPIVLSTTSGTVWAHRGGSYVYPEQSSIAYDKMIERTSVLDGDVRLLGDGTLVMLHDETVDRTTNGTGNVATFNAATFELLDCAKNFPWPVATKPYSVPAVFRLYASSAYFSLEPREPSNAYGVGPCYQALKQAATGVTGWNAVTQDTTKTGLVGNQLATDQSGTMTALQALRSVRQTTANRPSAGSVGQGAMIYDTTLGQPIWSTGSVWKDAFGITV